MPNHHVHGPKGRSLSGDCAASIIHVPSIRRRTNPTRQGQPVTVLPDLPKRRELEIAWWPPFQRSSDDGGNRAFKVVGKFVDLVVLNDERRSQQNMVASATIDCP